MMFAVIEPNLTRIGADKVTYDICAELKKLNINYGFSERNAEAALLCGCTAEPDSEIFGKCDIVIAVGGDGSIIRAAKYASVHSKPVLGINAGNVAFMAGLEANELSLLKSLITGNYFVDNRMMLRVEICRNGETVFSEDCLNDAVFARGAEIYLTEMLVDCDGAYVNKFRSDGIVVSTPTGSTAYSFAAGGPVVEPTLESIILTPISPYSKSSRCIIFSSESNLVVRPFNALRPVYLSCDGGKSVRIPDDAYVSIKKCEKYANFIRIKNDKFWHILDNKIEK